MDNPNTIIQTIKIEDGDVHNDDCDDQKNSTLLEHCKMETLSDDGIDLEATKVTPASGPNFCDHVDVPIKMEQTQDASDVVLETSGNSYSDRPVKIEYIPPDTEETGHTNGQENDTEEPSERICATGAVYEIHPIDDATDEKNEPDTLNDQKASRKSTPEVSPPAATKSDLLSALKQLGENKKYKCDRCERSFCDRMELKVHKRNHQFTVCPVCKRTMRTDFVKRHIARVHPDAGILPQDRPFPCNECERVFSNDVQLKNHQQSHRKQSCVVCGKILRADYLRRHMDLNHPKEVSATDGTDAYSCDMCEAVFSNKHVLFFHRRTHQTEECPVCKEVVRVGYLKIHIDTKHPDHSTLPANPAFQCDQCERAFGYKAALTLHKRKHRLTECPVCGTTIRTDCLKRHMDFNHPNELDPTGGEARSSGAPGTDTETRSPARRPQQTEECPVCKQTYRSDYVELHINLKHPNVATMTGGRSFQCDQCERSFPHKTQLRLHKRNHRVAECKICSKSMRMDCIRLHMSRMHPSAENNSSM